MGNWIKTYREKKAAKKNKECTCQGWDDYLLKHPETLEVAEKTVNEIHDDLGIPHIIVDEKVEDSALTLIARQQIRKWLNGKYSKGYIPNKVKTLLSFGHTRETLNELITE